MYNQSPPVSSLSKTVPLSLTVLTSRSFVAVIKPRALTENSSEPPTIEKVSFSSKDDKVAAPPLTLISIGRPSLFATVVSPTVTD